MRLQKEQQIDNKQEMFKLVRKRLEAVKPNFGPQNMFYFSFGGH